MLCSVYKNTLATDSVAERSLESILEGIRDGKFKERIEALRLELDVERRKALKKLLPAFTPSGIFSERKDDALVKHSGIICIDIDNDVRHYDALKGDVYCYCVHKSASGNGLAFYVKIDGRRHKEAYVELSAYLLNKYGVEADAAAKNVSRLRYVSFDEGLVINKDSVRWEAKEFFRNDLESLVCAIERSGKDLTASYEGWLKVALALASECGEAGRDYFHRLSRMHPKYKLEEADRKYSNALKTNKGQVNIGTLYYLASAEGIKVGASERSKLEYYIRNQKRAGVDDSDVRARLQNSNKLTVASGALIEEIYNEEEIELLEFWFVAGKGSDKEKLMLDLVKLYREFLPYKLGIFRYRGEGDREYRYVLERDNILRDVHRGEIKELVLEYISGLPFEFDGFFRVELLELVIRSSQVMFSVDKLEMLPDLEARLLKDSRDRSYFVFKNGFCVVSGNEKRWLEFLPLEKLPAKVWATEIIDRNFRFREVVKGGKVDLRISDFGLFLGKVCGEDASRLSALIRVLGYLLHRYKDSTRTVAPIFCDEEIADQPVGGTGKSLLLESVGKLRKVLFIDGKNFRWDKSFSFARYNEGHTVIAFDDVPEWFDFKKLFVILSKGLVVEKKGKDEFMIPFEASPKVAITTNYVVLGDSASFNRRKIDIEIANVYSEVHRPVDDFGKVFFEDWSVDEWEAFDCFMLYCCHNYLKNGLLRLEGTNLRLKYLIQSTSREFVAFMDRKLETNLGVRLGRQELYNEYMEDSGDDPKKLSKNRFKKWLLNYAKHNQMEIEEDEQWMEEPRRAYIFNKKILPHFSHTSPTP